MSGLNSHLPDKKVTCVHSWRKLPLIVGVVYCAGIQGSAQQSSASVIGPVAAEALFARLCVGCHGEGATGTDRGPALVNNRSLRSRSESQIQDLIRNGTLGGMPAFPLPEDELRTLAQWVHSLNASAYGVRPSGDASAGEKFFFGKGGAGLAIWLRAGESPMDRTSPTSGSSSLCLNWKRRWMPRIPGSGTIPRLPAPGGRGAHRMVGPW